ncbi:MAG TPA: transglycosylase SLT domain-containing protein [Thermoanaerobaculia bacterium]|nr:transglycosylase SLT domain-containing protein [Thermoanaerobaculia bacterium]
MRTQIALALGAILLSAACSSSIPVAPETVPEPPQPISADAQAQRDYRAALEASREHVLARETATLPETLADASVLSMEFPSHATIDGAVKYFSTGLRASIQESLTRSSKYRASIEKVLDQQGLPRALAWLPVIESAYIPTLTSRVGARGIWQFMPPTAREYGLRVDWWVDERADPEKSTKAAARYLKDLHRMFGGDWSLALAAYNCGPGRVERTLDREGVETFWELLERTALPKETRGYVPTFWATLRIVSDPASHGFELSPPAEPEVVEVPIEGPVSLRFVAEQAGVDAKSLKELNPHLTRGVVPPGRFKVRVPPAAEPTLAALGDRLRYEDPDLPVTRYAVQGGESIAWLAKVTGTKKDDIVAMNALRSEKVRPGTEIYLPVSTVTLSAKLDRARSETTYVVATGDTLYAIAKRHDITLAELLEMNDLSRNAVLQPGDEIKIVTGRGVMAR